MQAHKPVHEYFNPCSPCGERLPEQYAYNKAHVFQSMLPVRGATRSLEWMRPRSKRFQSMLPVRGATAKSDKIRVVFWQNSRSFR